MSRRAAFRLAIAAIVALAGTVAAEDRPVSWRRDPFHRVAQPAKSVESPLQGLSLAQLSLAAVLWGEVIEPRALLQDAEGTGFIVTTGTRVGMEGGTVSAIEPGRVVIASPDPASDHTRHVILELFPKAVVSREERKR